VPSIFGRVEPSAPAISLRNRFMREAIRLMIQARGVRHGMASSPHPSNAPDGFVAGTAFPSSGGATATAPQAVSGTRVPQTRLAMLELSQVFSAEALTQALNRLADAGWNSVVIPSLFEGYPIFFSQVWADYGLRRQHPMFRKWNPFEVAFDVAWRRGLDILVSHSPYRVSGQGGLFGRSPILRRYPRWAAEPYPKKKQRPEGAYTDDSYYCPVNPNARRFLCDVLHVLLEEYPFHGLVLDLRHYPFYITGEKDFVPWCYCKACREGTLRDLGFDPVSVDFATERGMVERWREWQASQMDQALAYIRMRALKARSTMRVLGLLTSDAGIAEKGIHPLIHWKTWLERSLVEALVLDGYSATQDEFEDQLRKDLETLPDHSLLLPMLPRKVEHGDAFLDVFQTLPIPGFATRFEDWDAPDFDPARRIELTSAAFPVESDPIQSVCILFLNMADYASSEEEFASFISDLVHVLLREDVRLSVERLLMVADNIRGLHEQISEGRLNFGEMQDQVLHDLDLAYRLIYLAFCDLKE
jgi:uncharacterized lipoprotein YddW (UPF0748 family)